MSTVQIKKKSISHNFIEMIDKEIIYSSHWVINLKLINGVMIFWSTIFPTLSITNDLEFLQGKVTIQIIYSLSVNLVSIFIITTSTYKRYWILSRDTAVNPFDFQCSNLQLTSVNVNYIYRYYT